MKAAEMGRYASSSNSLFHERLICADGFLFRCCHGEQSYIPEEMVNIRQLVESLEKELFLLNNSNNCDMRPSSPKAVPARRKESDVEGSLESRSGSFINKMSFYGSSPSKKRIPSTSSESNTPNSVLIKVTPKSDEENYDEACGTSLISNLHVIPLDKYEEQFKWLSEKGTEYVAMETLQSVSEVFGYLNVITKTNCPLLIDLKLNQDKSMTLTYHFCKAFKQDFMMLKVGAEYCMFMVPF